MDGGAAHCTAGLRQGQGWVVVRAIGGEFKTGGWGDEDALDAATSAEITAKSYLARLYS